MSKKCLDTYALWELVLGNPKFAFLLTASLISCAIKGARIAKTNPISIIMIPIMPLPLMFLLPLLP